jgi:hypothetical protein
MVNEYQSVGGGGPSPNYSGAGGGSPGANYVTPLTTSGAAAASVTGTIYPTSQREQVASTPGVSPAVPDQNQVINANLRAFDSAIANSQDPAARAQLENQRYLYESSHTLLPSTPGSSVRETAPAGSQQLGSSVTQRAGYTPLNDLGDSQTQRIADALDNPVFKMMGINVSREAVIGATLEAQRENASRTPGTTDDRFFTNEIQKWAENKVEKGEAYHFDALATGKPQAANPAEYSEDLAVEFLKGAPIRETERFSPVSG